jgi:hypothetical protein
MLSAVLLALFATAGMWGLVNSATVHRLRVARRLRAGKHYAIAALPESTPGRVVGIAQALNETLTSPLSGRACVYYEVKVITNSGGPGVKVLHERRGVPFVLLDGEVRAIVDPRHAELAVDVDVHTASGIFDDPTSAEAALLARHRQRGTGWIFNKVLRYEEAVIAIGETIAVFGTGVREPDPEAAPSSYRGELPTRIRLSGSRRFPLLISDKPSTTT